MRVRAAYDSQPAGEDVKEQAETDPSGEAFGEHGAGTSVCFYSPFPFFRFINHEHSRPGPGAS